MRIHYLKHVPFEGLGHIEEWAVKSNHQITVTRFFTEDTLPNVNDFDQLIIMGGPMSVNNVQIYPWLEEEKSFIRKVIDQDKPVLGICLGAQMIASVLGSKVYKCREKEIGWFPIFKPAHKNDHEFAKLFPDHIEVFHWHGETFDLPPGCINLAHSAVCENQAFIYRDKVIGLQFHLEATQKSITDLIKHASDELVDAPYIQKADQMLAINNRVIRINRFMYKIMEYLAGKYN